MGLKRFFKKAGAWFKDKFHKAKNVVVKFAKPDLLTLATTTPFGGSVALITLLVLIT